MTSSTEGVVIRGSHVASITPLQTPDLRSGEWTRMGVGAVRGDSITESTLSTLADRTRTAAHSEGYAVGWAQGVRESQAGAELDRREAQARHAREEARREAEHTAAVTALSEAARRLEHAAAAACERIEEQATALAWAVTTAVLGAAAVQLGPEDVVRRVLQVLPEGGLATVRLHPSVARHGAAGELPDGVSVLADGDLALGDALVELSDHVLDLRIDQALARVHEVLA